MDKKNLVPLAVVSVLTLGIVGFLVWKFVPWIALFGACVFFILRCEALKRRLEEQKKRS